MLKCLRCRSLELLVASLHILIIAQVRIHEGECVIEGDCIWRDIADVGPSFSLAAVMLHVLFKRFLAKLQSFYTSLVLMAERTVGLLASSLVADPVRVFLALRGLWCLTLHCKFKIITHCH